MAEVGEVWTHQNGRDYEILASGLYEEDQTPVLIYRGLHDGRVWVRPTANFLGLKDGRNRFERKS